MPNIAQDWIVETDWLGQHLGAPDLVVLDASWHLPTAKRDGRAEYLAEHIPGALFFDIEDLSDETSSLPHMLPPPAKFASRMKRMGIGDGMRVIVYDSVGVHSAARAWWMYRVMGHAEVALLNGGLKKWKAEGRAVESGAPPRRTERHFTARFDASLVRDLAEVRSLVAKPDAQLVDARSASRFSGEEKEFRAGLRSGHIPGSRNVHYTRLIAADGTLKPMAELRAAFADAGVDPGRPIVTTCGSGVSAAILSLALTRIGQTNAPVYDGSWSEWGRDDSGQPIATGPNP